MQLVRSVITKYCRSIGNRQSREFCTSLRNNDGNSRHERGVVRVLRDSCRQGATLAIAYGPYVALGGGLGAAGWHVYTYTADPRDSQEKHESKLLNQKMKALIHELEVLNAKAKQAIVQVGILSQQNHEHNEKIMDLDKKLEEITKRMQQGSQSFRNPATIMNSHFSNWSDVKEENRTKDEMTKQQAGTEE